MRCPPLRREEERQAFNSTVERLGGVPLSEDDVLSRQGYLDKLTEQQTDAYHRAHYLWNEHEANPTAIHDWLDLHDRVMEKLNPPGQHHAAYQERGDSGQFAGPPEYPASDERVTGIKHAVIEAERKLRGMPIFKKARRAHGVSFEEGVAAVESGEIDPQALAHEQATARRARPLSTTESMALLYDRMRIENDLIDAEKEFDAANKKGDPDEIEKATARVANLVYRLNLNDEADYRAGSEQGRGLAIRRLMIRDDYTLARVTATARRLNKDKPLPEEVQKQIADLTEQIRHANERIARVEKERDDALAKSARGRAVKDFRRDQTRVSKRQPADIDADADRLLSKLAKLTGKDPIAPMTLREPTVQYGDDGPWEIDPEVQRIIKELARNRVESGMRTADEVTKAVHEMVRDFLPGITEREVGDIYSSYGQMKQMSQDPLDVAMRDVNAQQRILAAIEDAERGERPLRTGLQHDKPSDLQRELRRKLIKTLRENGIQIEQSANFEQMQKSILDAAKTRLRNSIRDLDKEIATGEKLPPHRKLAIVYDDETVALMAERDMLRRQATDPTAKNKASLEDRIQEVERRLREGDIARRGEGYPPEIYDDAEAKQMRERLKGLNSKLRAAQSVPRERVKLGRQIQELERRIRERDFTRADQEPKPEVDPEIASLRAHRDDAKRILRELEGPRQLSNEERLRRYKKYLGRKERRLQQDLGTLQAGGTPEKVERPDLILDDEAKLARHNLAGLQRQIQQIYFEREWANKSRTEKALAYVAAGTRASVLSGTTVIGKIGSALGSRLMLTPIEEGSRGLWAKAFPRYAAKAPRYGGGFSRRAERAALRGAGEGVKQIPQLLKTGETPLDLERTESMKHRPMVPGRIGTVLSVPGRVHAAEKNVLKQSEYRRSQEMIDEWAARNRKDTTTDEYREARDDRAYKSAEEAILLGDNPFSSSLSRMEMGWGDKARSISRIIAPIRRVPPNYLSQMLGEYGLGTIRGAVRLLRARNPEVFENLTEDEADKTFRMLGRGTVGLLMMALVGLATGAGVAAVGGYYTGKRKKGDLKPGEVKIGGITIPHWLLHSPPAELGQVIGTIQREMEASDKKHESRWKGFKRGVTGSVKGIVSQVPFMNELTRAWDSMRGEDGLGKAVGEFVANRVEPQLLREMARATDRGKDVPFWQVWRGESVQRRPDYKGGFLEGTAEQFEQGVPVLRELVPESAGGLSDKLAKTLDLYDVPQPGAPKRKASESSETYRKRTQDQSAAMQVSLDAIVHSEEFEGLDNKEKRRTLKWAIGYVRHQLSDEQGPDPDRDRDPRVKAFMEQPDFQALPPAEQSKILRRIEPRFSQGERVPFREILRATRPSPPN